MPDETLTTAAEVKQYRKTLPRQYRDAFNAAVRDSKYNGSYQAVRVGRTTVAIHLPGDYSRKGQR